MEKRLITICVMLVLPLLVLATGCGGSGIGTSSSGITTISGSVVDGYVSGANVSIYDDLAMENRIGNGMTDLNGHFEISLTTGNVPFRIYMKSEGGRAVDTGLSAPTMRFVGGSTSGPYNITPITDHLYEETFHMGGDFQGAMNGILSHLNLTAGQLYGDPEMEVDVRSEMMKLITSGTRGGTLNPGAYNGFMMVFTGDMVDVDSIASVSDLMAKFRDSMTLTISSGGEISGQTGSGDSIKGRVSGTSVVMEVSDGTPSPGRVIRLAGEIGLMGCASGVATKFDRAGSKVTAGNFLITMLPSSGVDFQAVDGMIMDMSLGPHQVIGGDFFRGDNAQDLEMHWGNMSVDAINNGMMDITGFSLFHDSAPGTSTNMTVIEGRLDADGNGHPTLIKAIEFKEAASPMKEYIVGGVGSRRGVYLITDGTTGLIDTIGSAYMVRQDSLTPVFDSSSNYHLEIATLHRGLLGRVRNTSLINDEVFSGMDINTPSMKMGGMMGGPSGGMMGHMGGISTTGGLYTFSGSMMGWKSDQNTNHMGDPGDTMTLVHLYPSGAMSGEMLMGGAIDSSTLNSDFPGHYVAYGMKQGEQPPLFNGTLNFMERATYMMDLSGYTGAYGSGSISIDYSTSPPTATVTHVDSDGTRNEYVLSCVVTDGIYHMEGGTPMGTYMDIFWPLGGKQAAWMESDNPSGGGMVTAIGEAYMTY